MAKSKQISFSYYDDTPKVLKVKEVPKIPDGMVEVTFLKSVPLFVGIDMNNYGSYKKGDKAIIPTLNSIGLKKKEAII